MKDKENVIIEGLLYNNKQRKEYLDFAKKYKYNTYLINMQTNKELAYHLNHYRFLKNNVKLIPKVVYHTYNKYYEEPDKKDYVKIFKYYPKIKKRINKHFLY